MWLIPIIRRVLSSEKQRSPHLVLGARGEKLAADFLRRRHRYKILYRQYRIHSGEIDIVARDKDTLVFVEVKTRATEDFGTPAEAVDRDKRFRLSKAALDYLRRLGNPDIHFRFDIVEVVIDGDNPPDIRLIQNAFQLSEPFRY